MAKFIKIGEEGLEEEVVSGGSHVIQNNGSNQAARANLNLAGNNVKTADNATADSTNVLMANNLGKDWYINQNVYPALEWVWYHTDGYWYLVTMVLSQTSGKVGNNSVKVKVSKTTNWTEFIDVCFYEDVNEYFYVPKIALDSNGNILVVMGFGAAGKLSTIFFDASNSYSATFTSNIANNASYVPESTGSINISADNRFGVAFFQKHTGSTSYSQLMYVERSAGTAGTWGTPEILGSTPVRAATVTATGAVQLFYTSGNEPIIAFLNNQSATSSKVSVAKKVSGAWTIYASTNTAIYNAAMGQNDNISIATGGTVSEFAYSSNTFGNWISATTYYIAFADGLPRCLQKQALSATSLGSFYYIRHHADVFHRAISSYFQIGAVISANAYSTFGIYTVIPYSRQRLTNAWHLVVRTDGAIYMEII